jgi:hypothetical protein
MTEYAMIKDGRVTGIMMTGKPLSELRTEHPDYEIRPVDVTPISMLEKYQYWSERP